MMGCIAKVLLLVISSLSSCIIQNNEAIIDNLISSRIKYIKEEIPEVFSMYYESFNDLGYYPIFDTLKKILPKHDFRDNDAYYLIEFVPDGFMTKKLGVFWFGDTIISYEWNNTDQKIEIIRGHILDIAKPFLHDVEQWNEFVIDRSFKFSSIAGASYVFCSKVESVEGKLKIYNAVFREYDKNHFEYFLKERSNNGYKAIRVENSDY
jgi:hypothetical protein